MNDPHVVALEYRIEHGPDIDWSQAAPVDKAEDRFDVHAENGHVRFELKEHHASEESARYAVEACYIPNWEFDVGLVRGPNTFSLRFDRSEIKDRNPPSGPPTLSAHARTGVPTSTVNLAPPRPPSFPEPPRVPIKRSPNVDSMYRRYLRHLEGGEPLAGMAYYCLTTLEQMAGGRDAAALQFGISKALLRRIGDLSTNKGGASARKAIGRTAPHTPDEERFLKSAVRTVIRRAAEVAYRPAANCNQINLGDV